MVDQLPSYLFTKRDVYYYSRRIPSNMRAVYGRKRLVISLGTKSLNEGLSLSHALWSLISRNQSLKSLPKRMKHFAIICHFDTKRTRLACKRETFRE